MTHILILEDDLSMRVLLKTLLEIENFKVSVIETDSAAAITESITRLKPDIIFMDENMSGLSGLSILKTIKSDPKKESIKVVMTSGEDLQNACTSAGADGFFLKPYRPSDLIQKLRTLKN